MSKNYINEGTTGIIKKIKWYNNPIFPLIPSLITRKKDKYNTKGFTFTWLGIKVWSLDTFSFEVGAVIDTHWGVGLIGILPYIRWVCCIPISEKLGFKINNLLNRKPKNI